MCWAHLMFWPPDPPSAPPPLGRAAGDVGQEARRTGLWTRSGLTHLSAPRLHCTTAGRQLSQYVPGSVWSVVRDDPHSAYMRHQHTHTHTERHSLSLPLSLSLSPSLSLPLSLSLSLSLSFSLSLSLSLYLSLHLPLSLSLTLHPCLLASGSSCRCSRTSSRPRCSGPDPPALLILPPIRTSGAPGHPKAASDGCAAVIAFSKKLKPHTCLFVCIFTVWSGMCPEASQNSLLSEIFGVTFGHEMECIIRKNGKTL